jgi:hypothetical protein
MPNYGSLIITAAEYKVALNVPGVAAFPILTVNEIGWTETQEGELIYAVGEVNPIGNKGNAIAVKGKITIQEGELAALLAASGVNSVVYLPSCTISVVSLQNAASYTFTNIVFTSSAISVKAKDKESMRNIDFTALAIV